MGLFLYSPIVELMFRKYSFIKKWLNYTTNLNVFKLENSGTFLKIYIYEWSKFYNSLPDHIINLTNFEDISKILLGDGPFLLNINSELNSFYFNQFSYPYIASIIDLERFLLNSG